MNCNCNAQIWCYKDGYRMTEHYTKSTVAVQFFCKRCGRSTMHRVDKGRKGPCLDCLARLENKHTQLKILKPLGEQKELFK
jgi:hypothetical protein